jgi:hypothetical protein
MQRASACITEPQHSYLGHDYARNRPEPRKTGLAPPVRLPCDQLQGSGQVLDQACAAAELAGAEDRAREGVGVLAPIDQARAAAALVTAASGVEMRRRRPQRGQRNQGRALPQWQGVQVTAKGKSGWPSSSRGKAEIVNSRLLFDPPLRQRRLPLLVPGTGPVVSGFLVISGNARTAQEGIAPAPPGAVMHLARSRDTPPTIWPQAASRAPFFPKRSSRA